LECFGPSLVYMDIDGGMGVGYIFLVVIVVMVCVSVVSMWTIEQRSNKAVSFENFLSILFVYLTVMIGFGLIYAVLQVNGHAILLENGYVFGKGDFLGNLQTSFYFSAITLLSVGYGDIVPIGIGRWIAIIEALLGYALPAAFVVQTVMDFEKK
jgi:potassium channel LctB